MAIIPSKRTRIYFGPIPQDKKYYLFEQVKNIDNNQLNNLEYNHSAEGGFELIKTKEWCEYLDYTNQSIHTYQSTRQLRFIVDNQQNIIGGYCKDNINIFTDNELDRILELINKVIVENKLIE
jgi:hypothetical protein